jgi:hypothetical protein
MRQRHETMTKVGTKQTKAATSHGTSIVRTLSQTLFQSLVGVNNPANGEDGDQGAKNQPEAAT